MAEELHFVVYIESHLDLPQEVQALQITSEGMREDLKQSGYNIIGISAHGMIDNREVLPGDDILEQVDPVKQAEIIVQAHNLGEYERTHKAEVRARAKEILDAVQDTQFSAGLFEITTAAFIGRFIHNILRSQEPINMRDCLWLMAVGYYLGQEGQKWLKKK